MSFDLELFYIEVFVIIQAIIFLYVWSRWGKSKMLIKIMNQFIQYFNARFWFKPCGCKVSRWKIQKSSLGSWSFGSQWPIFWTLISSCVPLCLHRKKRLINFSFLDPCLPFSFSLMLDLYWLNLITLLSNWSPLANILHISQLEWPQMLVLASL